jgi:hypothetical protein
MSEVILFDLKNASDKYKGAMDLISHDLINHNIKYKSITLWLNQNLKPIILVAYVLLLNT